MEHDDERAALRRWIHRLIEFDPKFGAIPGCVFRLGDLDVRVRPESLDNVGIELVESCTELNMTVVADGSRWVLLEVLWNKVSGVYQRASLAIAAYLQKFWMPFPQRQQIFLV